MQKSFLLLSACIIASLCAGIIASIGTTRMLERYANTLLDDRQFAILMASHTPARVNENSLSEEMRARSLVYFADDDTGLVMGTGVVLSSDGWILTSGYALYPFLKTHRALSPTTATEVYEGFTILQGGRVFTPEKIISDTQTHAVAIKVTNVQGWTPVAFADMSEYVTGSAVVALDAESKAYPTTITGRVGTTGESMWVDDMPSWFGLGASDVATSNVFTSEGTFAGFSDGGSFESAQAYRPFVKQVLRGVDETHITHAALGLAGSDLSVPSAWIAGKARGKTQGVYVSPPNAEERTGIVRGGPANIAGITDGDIILACDDVQLTSATTIADLLATYAPGQEVVLKVDRDGEVRDMHVTLGTWEEMIY